MRKTKRWGAATLLAALAAGATQAAPICAQFEDPADMPRKYAKYAPVLSKEGTPWMITADQMDASYALSDESRTLLGLIQKEFEAIDVPLALIVPPPRPVVAGQAVLRDLNAAPTYDPQAIGVSFRDAMADLRDLGIIAPDLLELALSGMPDGEPYYFQRDTHWTPVGVVVSALALADAVQASDPGRFPNAGVKRISDLTAGVDLSERGSLTDMSKAVCERALPPEMAKTLEFAPTGGGLLSGHSPAQPQVALAGSSFSDRYRRDYYRVADALAGALGAEVDNFSVSGGGPIGGLESLIQSGAVHAGEYDLVIWELPYTEGFNGHFLRQLLGALRAQAMMNAASQASPPTKPLVRLPQNTQKIDLDVASQTEGTLLLSLPNSDVEKLSVSMRLQDGRKKVVKLRRSLRVPEERRATTWAVSLEGYGIVPIKEMWLTFKGGTPGADATVTLF